jgi:hypothetical protein
MKQIILMLALISAIDMAVNAQPLSPRKHRPEPELQDKAYYLKKRDNLNTAGWILLGTGSALFITGYCIYQNNIETNWGGLNAIPGDFCMIIGGSAVITSIALFTRASNYKRKAMEISADLQEEKIPFLQGSSVASKAVPALSIRINF